MLEGKGKIIDHTESESSYRLYRPWVVYFVIAVTIAGYCLIRDDWNIYAMTGKALQSGQSYRLVTSLIMHGGWKHLIFNMIALLLLGSSFARVEGNQSFILVYLCGGILANLTDGIYVILTGNDIAVTSAGASCAIMSVLGAIISETFVHPDFKKYRTVIIITSVVYFVLCNQGRDINVDGHLWGLIWGIILGFLSKILTLLEVDKEKTHKSIEKRGSL